MTGGIWRRLCAFARAEPVASRFLERQDHAPYLAADSRALARAVLHPIGLGHVTLDDATLDRTRVAACTAVMATTEPRRLRG